MINSISANVVPPNVPSARRGIKAYGQSPEPAQAPKPQKPTDTFKKTTN